MDAITGLPRFNMALELGIFLGAMQFGEQKSRHCLILDREPLRYRLFCSDIAGYDPKVHNGDYLIAVGVIRNWLRGVSQPSVEKIPGSLEITQQYLSFRNDLPGICLQCSIPEEDLAFVDYSTFVTTWLQENPFRG